MAAFFTINIIEFPQDPSNGGNGMKLGWVSKYLFGIGFALSVPLIAVAFFVSDMKGWIWHLKNWFGRGRMHASSRQAHSGADPAGQFKPPTIIVRRSLDSENRIYPRRQTTRISTGLTDGTAHSV